MSQVNVDTINEYNSAAGVTIDGLLIKDGAIPSIAGGLEEVDVWHLTTDFTGDASPIASNLSRWATTWEKIGTGMTESSGIFTFPSTGIWRIEFLCYMYLNGDNRGITCDLETATDGTTFDRAASAAVFIQQTSSNNTYNARFDVGVENEFNRLNLEFGLECP